MDSVSATLQGLVRLLSVGETASVGAGTRGRDGVGGGAEGDEDDPGKGALSGHGEDEVLMASTLTVLTSSEMWARPSVCECVEASIGLFIHQTYRMCMFHPHVAMRGENDTCMEIRPRDLDLDLSI